MTTSSRATSKPTLTLVRFKGYLYPKTESDYAFLKERNYFNFKIPESTLPFIKKSGILKCSVVVEDFQIHWNNFRAKFSANIQTLGALTERSPKEYLLLTDDLGKHNVENYLDQVTQWSQRYCVRLRYEVKSRSKSSVNLEKEHLYRITFEHDDTLNNAFGFDSIDKQNASIEVHLAKALKLKLELLKLDSNGTQAVSFSFLEKKGDNFSEFTKRVAQVNALNKEEIRNLINFLTSLL